MGRGGDHGSAHSKHNWDKFGAWQVPLELGSGRCGDISALHVFGCPVYVKVPDERRRKLDIKALRCVFVGYEINKKGYRCLNPANMSVITARDCIFVREESVQLFLDDATAVGVVLEVIAKAAKDRTSTATAADTQEYNFCDVLPQHVLPVRLRSQKVVKVSSEDVFQDAEEDSSVCLMACEEEPGSFVEATRCLESSQCRAATEEEMRAQRYLGAHCK